MSKQRKKTTALPKSKRQKQIALLHRAISRPRPQYKFASKAKTK